VYNYGIVVSGIVKIGGRNCRKLSRSNSARKTLVRLFNEPSDDGKLRSTFWSRQPCEWIWLIVEMWLLGSS